MHRALNILFLSTWFPYPLDVGARIRVHYLLRTLAERHNVHLIGFAQDDNAACFLPTLRQWCVQVDVVRRDPFWRDPLKAKLGYLSLTPRDVISGYCPEMTALVQQAVRQRPFDAVIASITNVAPYALEVPRAVRMLEEHNFLTVWMEERYRSQDSPLRKTAYWMSWLKNRRYERWLFPKFETITMVSEHDLCAVRENISNYRGRLEMIPNGVDIGHNRPDLAEPQPDTLVFNGSLTYNANHDAMSYFLSEIFPLIRARRPQVRLKITGRTEGANLEGITGQAGVTLTGFLDDVRPSVSESWGCVVPLRIGSGTRLKILEAMALGTPVVSTSKGAEGLLVTPGKELLIADDPQAFAEQTLRLLDDPALRMRMARDARALVEYYYSWERISEQFSETVESMVNVKQKRASESRQ